MKIRFLPFMIYASIIALIARIETMGDYKKKFISLVGINDLNASQEEQSESKADNEKKSQASAEENKVKNDDNVSYQRPEEFNCSKNNFSEADLTLLQNLSKRRQDLDKKNGDIEIKEALLKAAELKLDNKLTELKNLKLEINELLVQYNQKEDMKINSLVKIYENMKPKEAAKIFNGLDMPLLLEVLDKMKGAKAAPIMAQMDPAKATEITEKYAEQKKIIPEQPAQ